MDIKLFASTFALVFLAELGDKTQLATLTLSAGNDARWSVFLGSALALVASAALAVLVGAVLAQYLPVRWVQRFAGLAFIAMGLLLVFRPAEAAPPEPPAALP